MDIAAGAIANTEDALPDATRFIYIYVDKLILPGEYNSVVIPDWVERSKFEVTVGRVGWLSTLR